MEGPGDLGFSGLGFQVRQLRFLDLGAQGLTENHGDSYRKLASLRPRVFWQTVIMQAKPD